MTILQVDLDNNGGATYLFQAGERFLSLEMKYNYASQCWLMDVYDEEKILLASGIMLVPNIDLFKGNRQLKSDIGSFTVIEEFQDSYKDPDALGKTTLLFWISPDEL